MWQISLPFQGEPEIVGSYLIVGETEIALIDPGPGSVLEAQLAAIREAGFDPSDVTHLILTHIHLDHAGMTGSLLRSEEHTSELQSRRDLVCRLLLEKKKKK